MVVGGWGVTGGRDGGDNCYADGYEFNTGSTTDGYVGVDLRLSVSIPATVQQILPSIIIT